MQLGLWHSVVYSFIQPFIHSSIHRTSIKLDQHSWHTTWFFPYPATEVSSFLVTEKPLLKKEAFISYGLVPKMFSLMSPKKRLLMLALG
ncbi:hypothetical protein Y032_0395g658 [Ancylostoma ceylanicum]|uniref:Uncharacterized protein n=1 Tax=Ancylostoma ceylanicum TaxID=53326 RepID=A0A016RRI5_9BILA|nr:hypothetical protein Y032_0395g658 [Ancylostoma ceylanicum]